VPAPSDLFLNATRQNVRDLIFEIAANELRLSILKNVDARWDLVNAMEAQAAQLSSALAELQKAVESSEKAALRVVA
jgi:hypothetical protein